VLGSAEVLSALHTLRSVHLPGLIAASIKSPKDPALDTGLKNVQESMSLLITGQRAERHCSLTTYSR
jgi:hypothetical protein